MKIAIAQTEIMFEQPEENLANAAAWIAQAALAQADCVVFPEMSFTGFSMQVEKIAGYAPKIHEKMRQLAVQCGIAIGYGWTSQEQHGKGENHYTLLDKNGGVLSDYVKIHPFSYGGEDRFYHSGEKLTSAVLGEFSVGTLICYDLRFPEVFRAAAQKNRLLLVPANWLHQRTAHWRILLRARAIENQVYVLGVNCVGRQQSYTFDGQSCLVNPEGELLCTCGGEKQLVYVTIADDTEQFRQAFPTCRDVKISLYRKLYEDIF